MSLIFKPVYMRFLIMIWVCISLISAAPVMAQTPDTSGITPVESVTPLPPSSTESAIRAAQTALRSNAGLNEDQIKEANELYNAALTRFQTIAELRSKAAESKILRTDAAARIQKLEDEIDQAETQLEAPLNIPDQELSEQALLSYEQRIAELEADAERLRRALEELEVRLTEANKVSTGGAAERDRLRGELGLVNDRIAGFATDGVDPIEEARQAVAFVRRAALEQEIETLLQREQAAPLRLKILPLERQLIRLRLAITDRELTALRQKTGAFRAREIEARIVNAQAAVDAAGTAHPLVQEFARDNLVFAKQLKTIEAAGGNLPVLRSRLQAETRQITNDRELAESILGESDIGRKYGGVLRQLRDNLPEVGRLKNSVSTRSKLRLDISMQRVLAQNRLQDFPASGINVSGLYAKWRRTHPDSAPLTSEDETQLRALYKQQRVLLTELISAAVRQSSELSEVNALESELANETNSLVKLLETKLIWLPSAEPISLTYLQELVVSTQRLFSKDNFDEVAGGLKDGLYRNPFLTLFLTILTILTLLVRPKLRKRVTQMAPHIGRVQTDQYSFTPIAILSGAVAALRIALPCLIVAILLINSGDFGFAPLAGQALLAVGLLVLGLESLRNWAREGALLEKHFKVKPALTRRLRRNLRWFTPLQAISALLVVTCVSVDGEASTAALGVLGFIIATLSMAWLAYRILLARQMTYDNLLRRDGIVARYRKVLFGAALLLPLIITALAISGYFATALEVQGRILLTAAVAIFAYLMYGLSRRSLTIAQRRAKLAQLMELRKKAEKERKERQEAEERGEDAPATAPVDYETIDIEQMSRQSSQLLNLAILIGASVMVYVLWASLLPALTIFDTIELHRFKTGNIGVDGSEIETVLTLWSIIQAIAFTILTIIAVRNLPGLLELFVLQRTGLKESSRYAITTVMGYIIIIIGFLFAFNKLGLQWSSMKWIVGGLSVGIGFGLQEIIANFISGLIILFERPVRIGDYVTIGDQSGTVSRIQIRATTLTNLDNLEIVIPNKELITGRVTNWTLTTSMTRLAVKVGIAYGSDTTHAHKVMLETAKANSNVLKTPEPKVLFMGFGDSSLDFEVRVYLPSFDLRVPMTHELHMALNDALAKAGITIPFPQRDLHLMSSNIDFGSAQRLPAPEQDESKTGAKPKPA